MIGLHRCRRVKLCDKRRAGSGVGDPGYTQTKKPRAVRRRGYALETLGRSAPLLTTRRIA
jgi:hypothetical protein